MHQNKDFSLPYKQYCVFIMHCGIIFLLIGSLTTSADKISDKLSEEVIMAMSKCSRFYYTETVSHPKKNCSPKVMI